MVNHRKVKGEGKEKGRGERKESELWEARWSSRNGEGCYVIPQLMGLVGD